jgi:hypothetical protein
MIPSIDKYWSVQRQYILISNGNQERLRLNIFWYPSHESNPMSRHYRGINKVLPWAVIVNLRIRRIHFCITQEEVNKWTVSKIVSSCLSLNNRSSCADGHVCFTFCHLPWDMSSELSFSFSTSKKFIQPKFTEDLQHSVALKHTVFEESNTGINSSIASAKIFTTIRGPEDLWLIL